MGRSGERGGISWEEGRQVKETRQGGTTCAHLQILHAEKATPQCLEGRAPRAEQPRTAAMEHRFTHISGGDAFVGPPGRRAAVEGVKGDLEPAQPGWLVHKHAPGVGEVAVAVGERVKRRLDLGQ